MYLFCSDVVKIRLHCVNDNRAKSEENTHTMAATTKIIVFFFVALAITTVLARPQQAPTSGEDLKESEKDLKTANSYGLGYGYGFGYPYGYYGLYGLGYGYPYYSYYGGYGYPFYG